jgi:hypothetical protein
MTDRWCRLIVGGSVFLSALWIGLGCLHAFHDGDTIIPVLVSLQRWTVFYWSQNRYGMLVPLLAMSIQDPLWNLIAQAALDTLAGFVAVLLITRYVLGPSPIWMAAALVENAWVLLFTPRAIQFHWYVGQAQYGIAMALGLAALLTRRTPLALLVMLLAAWVNVTIAVILFPLVLARYTIHHNRTATFREALVVAGGSAGGLLLLLLSPYQSTALGFAPISTWPHAWARLVIRAYELVIPDTQVLWWLVIPAVLGLVSVRRRVWGVAGVLAGASILCWLVTGTSSWVRINQHSPSYVLPALIVMLTAFSIVAVAPFERYGRWIAVTSAGLLLLAAGSSSGRPSPTRVRQVLDAKFGAYTAQILATDATGIAGDYWLMWPTVYHANLVAYRRGLHRTFYGRGYRDDATKILWSPERDRIFEIH